MRKGFYNLLLLSFFIFSCKQQKHEDPTADSLALPSNNLTADTSDVRIDTSDMVVNKMQIRTGNIQPQQIVDFAKTLIGTKYKYGSINPAEGFDCSGFITYVFNHFNIKVPRSSIDFTEVGRTVSIDSAKPGDLILFTGTDSTERHIGHMGIIVANKKPEVEFIHSTSGKQFGVTITPLNKYYLGRFMRIARVFLQNEK